MSNLAFLAVDTLGMAVYEKEGRLQGKEQRIISIGEWQLPLDISATSDVITPKEVSFFIEVTERLWFYLIVTETMGWLMVVDADIAELTKKNLSTFGGVSAKETVKKLKPAIKASFKWTDKTNWGKLESKPVDTGKVQ